MEHEFHWQSRPRVYSDRWNGQSVPCGIKACVRCGVVYGYSKPRLVCSGAWTRPFFAANDREAP